jgi:hypothetical protein
MLILIAAILSVGPAEDACTALASEAIGFRNDSASAMIAGLADQQVAARQQALVWYTATALACREGKREADAAAAIRTAKEIVAEFDAGGPWTPETCRRRQAGLVSSRTRIEQLRHWAAAAAAHLDRAIVPYTNAVRNKCRS